MNLKIKEKYKNKVVGFNNSTIPLGQRDDIEKLAEIALRSNDKTLLELFMEPPTLEELNSKKGHKLIQEIKSKRNDTKI